MTTKTHCPQGHDIAIVGRNSSNGRCAECQRIHSREYKARNQERIREQGRLDRELYRRVLGKAATPRGSNV
jgi:hypothetical protein